MTREALLALIGMAMVLIAGSALVLQCVLSALHHRRESKAFRHRIRRMR